MNNAKVNYQTVLEETLTQIKKEGRVPRLLLHSCCAPCSSYVIEYLSNYFYITVFYYNPNIDEKEEYEKRAREQQKFIQMIPTSFPVQFVEGEYDVENFLHMAEPLANEPEGGRRCFACYGLRLKKTAEYAKAHGFDYFTTTLSISPLKNAQFLNEIGKQLQNTIGIPYLFSDFKKKNGYQRSTVLSKEFGLYRQNYCGCSYSKKD